MYRVYVGHFIIQIGPCARYVWSKTHVLSEYKSITCSQFFVRDGKNIFFEEINI